MKYISAHNHSWTWQKQDPWSEERSSNPAVLWSSLDAEGSEHCFSWMKAKNFSEFCTNCGLFVVICDKTRTNPRSETERFDIKTFGSEIERFVKSSLQIEAGSADPYNTMRIIAESWYEVHLSKVFLWQWRLWTHVELARFHGFPASKMLEWTFVACTILYFFLYFLEAK